MKITIHRGIDQIGGCITEIATDTTRILIDLGQNLPDREGVVKDDLSNHDAIKDITQGIDAVFYTHYHGDHVGLFRFVPKNICQFIGAVAKSVMLHKHRSLSLIKGREAQSADELARIKEMNELSPDKAVKVGNMMITPFLVSHSAFDAYMFLIAADGKTVLHTGDFRGHGYLSKGLLPTIGKLILPHHRIDFLITEGTMLSRAGEQVKSEYALRKEALEIMAYYKNVFIMCSSSDLERLATFYHGNKLSKNGPLVCDYFQKKLFEVFTKTAGRRSSLFRFDHVYVFDPDNNRLAKWMTDKGFCMFVRANDKFRDYYLQSLAPQLNSNETVLIYSMWNEYINPGSDHAIRRYIDFVSLFPNLEKLHTSGHASADCLAEVCNLINPALGIIPIHIEKSANFANLPIHPELKEKIFTSSGMVDEVEIHISPFC